MSHTIYTAKFEQTIIHQHVHLRRESRSHAPVYVLMRLYPIDKLLVCLQTKEGRHVRIYHNTAGFLIRTDTPRFVAGLFRQNRRFKFCFIKKKIRRRKRATWTQKNDMWLFYRPYEKKNRYMYSTLLKENPKFVYRRLLWVKLSAKTKSLNKDFKAKFWNNLSDVYYTSVLASPFLQGAAPALSEWRPALCD